MSNNKYYLISNIYDDKSGRTLLKGMYLSDGLMFANFNNIEKQTWGNIYMVNVDKFLNKLVIYDDK
jgi:hypothetical protein